MTTRERAVIVKQLPEMLSGQQGQIFLGELQNCMEADRPRIVLDCSTVRQLDGSGVQLLLRCLEEAMKRNGNVKLAALSAEAGEVLKQTGANRLFDVYETTAEAVKSFDQPPAGAMS